ncbi:hypothetical protein P3102_19690 [Amycolatopsis sp. QT-25]|uniref:hypothetical protein n=1 Tax=Amycolatopsis sp. QT-25 TaxID=3034022 RepID=UPI0023EDC826|nr:hypothetical protein [Amycolatopsis sp. QT-25]WET76354.1 hypothetical protein P3102_19690 [Amycolatopsis sp. QT-25]
MTMPPDHEIPPTEQSEVDRLRAENALLRTEKDLLLKAAIGFATDAGAFQRRHRKPETR